MTKIIGLRPDETVRTVVARSRAWLILIVCVSAFPAFLEGFDVVLFQFGAPDIVRGVGASIAMLGVLTTGYTAGITLFSLVGGFLFDRLSAKWIIVASVLLFTIFTVASGFAPNLWTLIVCRLLVGIGIGMFQPAIVALLGDIFVEARGKAVSGFALLFGAGAFLAPYFIAPFLPDYRIPFVITSIAGLVSLVVFILLVPQKMDAHEVTQDRLALKDVKKALNKNVVLLAATVLFFGITLAGYFAYYSEYLLKVLALDTGSAAMIASFGGLGTFIFAYPLGMLADRAGRLVAVRVCALLILIGSVCIFIVGPNVFLLAVLTLTFGAGWGMLISLVPAAAQDSVPMEVSGTVVGFMFAMFNLGAVVGGPLFGALLPMGFVPAAITVMGGASAITVLASLFARTARATVTSPSGVTEADPTSLTYGSS